MVGDRPEFHHETAKAILERFRSRGGHPLRGIRRETSPEIIDLSPRRSFGSHDEHTWKNDDGTLNYDYERFLSDKIEKYPHQIFKRVCKDFPDRKPCPSFLNENERTWVLDYIFFQITRSPEYKSYVSSGGREDLIKKFLPEEKHLDLESNSEAELDNLWRYALFTMHMSSYKNPSGLLEKFRTWKVDWLWHQSDRLSLVIGSNSVVIEGKSINLLFEQKSYWLPISPNILVGAIPPNFVVSTNELSDDQITGFNEVIFNRSDHFVMGDEQMLTQLQETSAGDAT